MAMEWLRLVRERNAMMGIASSSMDVRHSGDGKLETALGEQCDDRNLVDGDGCSSQCLQEPGAFCYNKPGEKSTYVTIFCKFTKYNLPQHTSCPSVSRMLRGTEFESISELWELVKRVLFFENQTAYVNEAKLNSLIELLISRNLSRDYYLLVENVNACAGSTIAV